jgi:glycosyltransferase involved in cell wall biosynthesis
LKKIKILRIIARLNIGGPAIHTILLTRYLNNEKFDSLLVTGNIGKDEGDMVYLAEMNNVRPIVMKELGRDISWRDDIIAFYKVLRLIIKEKPDVIHTHTAKAGTLGRTAGIIYNLLFSHKAYLVHTFHGHTFQGYFHPVKARLFLLIERFLSKFTHRIITISRKQMDELSENLKINSHGKLELIPLGLNLSQFYETKKIERSFKKSLGLEGDVRLVGSIGRLVPVKNHRMFLDAIKKYKLNPLIPPLIKGGEGGLKVKFLLIGDGELRKDLERYSRESGISGDVIFTGWIRDLCMAYADIDIVVLTSLNEGTPVSIIEAMASGKPVIATDVGGVRDLFTIYDLRFWGTHESGSYDLKFKIYSEGILINSNDSDSLAEGIKFLLDNPELAEDMGRKGRVNVKERFDIQRLVSDVERMYEGLISNEQ